MFRSDEFLTVARHCKTGHRLEGEAALRTAVSRAYYAVYHRIWLQGYIRDGRRFTRGVAAHTEVKLYLSGLNVHWGKDLEELRRMRNRADYDLYYRGGDLHDDTQYAIDMADQFFQRIPDPGEYDPYA